MITMGAYQRIEMRKVEDKPIKVWVITIMYKDVCLIYIYNMNVPL